MKFSLLQHELVVSSLDWHHETGLLVSCSHDRQAFVWKFHEDTGTWENQFVVVGIPRAAITAKWNKDGDQFVITSSAKQVGVFTYDEGNNWWVREVAIQKHHKATYVEHR